ncbi:tripartite tricarboxylate transporter TctB family protein [Rhodoferax sp.]|uniref:tripartite tricarboxylate transporter TctB family protein n=1 Tax=Rhodoferax sp. TaxID=50421 RepID=UPI00261E0AA0|nr:tripartite tricarboxylate transporter TctB family protein [Rhodoferax sp.]MDD2808598.1 tripartite tricarboxylate transporter TctB family protein [Rhodoferax sp.]
MGDRILGGVCLVVALAMAWAAHGYAAEISYEPVGPRAFPTLLAALMGLAGVWLLVKKPAHGVASGTPVLAATSALDWKAVTLCAASCLIYTALFQTLGFWLATSLMAVPVGMAFGGTLKKTLLGGVVMGLGFYLMFDKLLDVVLPTGVLSFLLGGR